MIIPTLPLYTLYTPYIYTNWAGSLSSTEENSGQAVELCYFKLAVALSHDV